MSRDISALWAICFSDGTYEKLLDLKEYIIPEKWATNIKLRVRARRSRRFFIPRGYDNATRYTGS